MLEVKIVVTFGTEKWGVPGRQHERNFGETSDILCFDLGAVTLFSVCENLSRCILMTGITIKIGIFLHFYLRRIYQKKQKRRKT